MIAPGLILVSLAAGGGVGWVFCRVTDRSALRTVRKRMAARVLELRLFADDPVLLLRAQGALIAENAWLLRLLLPAALISGLPFAWIAMQAGAWYGSTPLRPGEVAIVTAQMEGALEDRDAASRLKAGTGVVVETPPVRDFADHQISWRIRALESSQSSLRLMVRGVDIDENVSAGRHKGPSAKGLRWVEIDYPQSQSWLWWFWGFASAAALVVSRYA